MNGIELSFEYYKSHGEAMLQGFPDILPFLAVGICGSGSECFGYDDEQSRDHDFEPGFCIFLPSEDIVSRRDAFELERAYEKLPQDFMGLGRQRLKPVGGARHGVIRTEDFFASRCGHPTAELSDIDWLKLPEYSLAEAMNGRIFFDNYGEFSAIRSKLSHYSEDLRLKKLAGYLLIMAQSGQYNYPRCVKRGETAAAQLAVFEFVRASLHCIFLLNRRYLPYYKWSFRALRELPALGNLSDSLEFLLSSDNSDGSFVLKTAVIEDIAGLLCSALKDEGIDIGDDRELEPLAYRVNGLIKDISLRGLDIFIGVEN